VVFHMTCRTSRHPQGWSYGMGRGTFDPKSKFNTTERLCGRTLEYHWSVEPKDSSKIQGGTLRCERLNGKRLAQWLMGRRWTVIPMQ
jgi:hypothetical protein